MTEQELLDLKQEMNAAKEKLSKLEGRRDALLEQLQEKYNVESADAAKRKIKSFEKQIQELDGRISAKTEELESKLYEQSTNTEE
jgi:flagellar biosynthesis chaperone FliJ